tara:strand:+ start:587 stop:757 length:171 start_codon:yes stop_codon:yes gene_type:complete
MDKYIEALEAQIATLNEVSTSQGLSNREKRYVMAGYEQSIMFLKYLVEQDKELSNE